jgi:putative tricarboxylic transport membrane protein
MTNEGIISLVSLFSPTTVLLMFAGTFLGIVVGALPGLTATMAVSLLVSLTYGMKGANAIIMLISVYLGGIYGGSRSAILLNIPGTPSSAATALDGWPLNLKGKGKLAGISVTTFSVLGGLFGLLMLVIACPPLADFALKFGYWEYFWLAIMGILISASITSETKMYKGVLAGMFGLLVSTVGIDPIHGYPRFVFGYQKLMGGINLVPAMIGLFGLSEVFSSLMNQESHNILEAKTEDTLFTAVKQSFRQLKQYFRVFSISSVIGTLIGALPGTGPDIASWVSYGTAKRTSKHKEEFGKGSWEGIIASETANNAATSGVFIPLLTLGIPGDAVSAVIMGGIQLHGYRPGPTFFFDSPGFIYFIAGALLLVNIVMWFEGVAITPIIAKILKAPVGIIMPIVVVLCVVGAYTINLLKFDVIVMLLFGFLGMVMRRFKIPAAPMTLGIILGSLADLSFRRGIMAGRFSILPFLTRPISLFLVVALALALILPLLKKRRQTKGNI